MVNGADFGYTTDGGPYGAGFEKEQLYSTASYQAKNLTGLYLENNDLTGWDLHAQNLRNAAFHFSNLTKTNFEGATVTGANFYDTTSRGFTKEQLYSTASYRAKNLGSIGLGLNELSGWDFAGQKLVGASFESATLGDADFAAADLHGSTLQFADLTRANLSGANLANAYMYGTNLTDANLRSADARGAKYATLTGANTSNLIRPDGHIAGLDLTAGASLVVRNYHGNPAASPPTAPLPVVVDQHLAMDSTGTLRLEFDADHWDSTISFAPGLPVTLGGSLELAFATGVNPAGQVGRTMNLFDWTGVTPTGSFNVDSYYSWDLSRLYTSGEVTLSRVVPDANRDGRVDFSDLLTLAQNYGKSTDQAFSAGDFNNDGVVDFSDLLILAQNYGFGTAQAAVSATPEPTTLAAMPIGAAMLLRRRRDA